MTNLILFKSSIFNSDSLFKKINIETYHDVKNRVIYIHLESIYDTSNILDKLLKSKDEDEAQVTRYRNLEFDLALIN